MIKNKQKLIKLNYPGVKKEKPNTWITAYDYTLYNVAEKAGIDMILVGDSGGMVQYGLEDTTPVTMEMSINMCKAVKRGAPNTF